MKRINWFYGVPVLVLFGVCFYFLGWLCSMLLSEQPKPLPSSLLGITLAVIIGGLVQSAITAAFMMPLYGGTVKARLSSFFSRKKIVG